MKNEDAEALLIKYRSGQCTEQEKALLESWYIQRGSQGKVDLSEEELETILDEIWNTLPVHREDHLQIRRFHFSRLAVAASLLLFILVGAYFVFHISSSNQPAAQNQIHDIAPGGNKAILTLANGQQIVLTGAKNGKLAEQGNTAITKTADGEVIYENSGAGTANPSAWSYNAIATPVGGEYHLILSDGTGVWLNALSSIKYPIDFTDKDRQVEVTGEVYFEVAHNAAKPFKVVANQQVVEVLGTHFNIKSYPDESDITTTLLEGSVKVTGTHSFKVIKPGQQSVLQNDNLSVNDANVEEAIAWKNGYFRFNDEKIKDVMKRLSRWYNIEVSYEGEMSEEGFNGKISRYKNISQVLKMLEKTGAVHFKIEGRRVTVIQ